MERTFYKVHGSGNTFYLYETHNEMEFDWAELTKWLCNEENEGGADGLLLVLPSKDVDAKMRVINADGSEASMCGNGLRCVARHVCEKLGKDEAIIETMKANLKVKMEESIFGTIPTFAVEISPVSFKLTSLPMIYKNETEFQHQIIDEFSPDIKFTAVSVPNPHLIGIVNEKYITDNTHQSLLAKSLNGPNDYCSDGINVSYAFPMNNDTIFVRTFERGVGFTNACGTAMTASALVAKMNHLVEGDTITVLNPGGFVKCRVFEKNGDYELTLIGNATIIASYVFELQQDHYKLISKKETDEQLLYENCLKEIRKVTASILS